MGIMHIQDQTGDTEVRWNEADPATVAEATRIFDELLNKQHLAYKTEGAKAEHIRQFDPTASEIIIAVPLVGG
jgi:hypothetical protein